MTKDDINHIISHTHWDREWYLPFQNYRFRLVKLFHRCFEVFENENIDFKFFYLDGQTIVIEDYLEIEPENKERLGKLIREGKIGIGPWYLLNSPWLQTGEGNIRNLLMGNKICNSFGVNPQNLGYVPDQFVLFPQLVQIMKGFGIDHVAFSRGINDQYEKDRIDTEFKWKGPDGSVVTLFHLRNGYGMAFFLPNDPLQALNQVVFYRGPLEPLPRSTNQVLMFNGSDHADPDPILPEVIEIWNDEEDITDDFGKLKHSNWEEFFHDFWEQNPDLKIISGELVGHKYHFACRGVYSNRMPIKQENFELHNLLEKYSEPFTTLSWVFGGEYKSGFIRTAWKYLLKNQPHDSSWGASHDPIIKDMWTRFRWTRQIADEVFRRSAHEIIIRMKIKQLKVKNPDYEGNRYYITIFNPSAWGRTDYVKARFPIEKEDDGKPFILRDSLGDIISAKFARSTAKGSDRNLLRTFVPSHGPLPSIFYDVEFLAPQIPALGYETYSIEVETNSALNEDFDETYVNGTDDFLENLVIKVLVEKNGTLTIIDKINNKKYNNFNLFEDSGNKGCGYEFIPIENDTAINTSNCNCKSKLIEACPAYSEIKIEINWKIPYSITEDESSRTEKLTNFNIITYLKVYPGYNKRIDLKTQFVNTSKWHQLKALFPTDLNVETEFVKGPFQILERPIDTPWDFEGKYANDGSFPQHSFMGIFDETKKFGICILNKGLPVYRTKRDNNKNIIIELYLFRAQGKWIAHLGLDPNIDTPEAQWLGKEMICEYSIIPLDKNWKEMNIPKIAEEYNSPLRSEMHWDVFRLERYQPKIDLPPIFSLVEILKGKVEITALKKSEDKNDLVIRLYNWNNNTEDVLLRLSSDIKELSQIDLKEDIVNNEEDKVQINILDDNKRPDWMNTLNILSKLIQFRINPFKIITLSLTLKNNILTQNKFK